MKWILHVVCIFVAASKCSRNHFISEKYKTVQYFKLHVLQNSLLVKLYTAASDSIAVGNNPGSHFVKDFAGLLSHS